MKIRSTVAEVDFSATLVPVIEGMYSWSLDGTKSKAPGQTSYEEFTQTPTSTLTLTLTLTLAPNTIPILFGKGTRNTCA